MPYVDNLHQKQKRKIKSDNLQALPPDLGLLLDASIVLLGGKLDGKDVASLNGLSNRGDIGNQFREVIRNLQVKVLDLVVTVVILEPGLKVDPLLLVLVAVVLVLPGRDLLLYAHPERSHIDIFGILVCDSLKIPLDDLPIVATLGNALQVHRTLEPLKLGSCKMGQDLV